MTTPPEPRQPWYLNKEVWIGVTVLLTGIPIVWAWLALAVIIIYSAVTDSEVLGSIEGLLTALAVLTVIVDRFVTAVTRKWLGSD
tara:strand:+ start:452 stop:706 length:255 start_codon:yes stop_codon:yes gene_type:complete